MIELPVILVEILSPLMKRYRLLPLMPYGALTDRLEILRLLSGICRFVLERVGHGDAMQRHLFYAIDSFREVNVHDLEDRGHHVDHMIELAPRLTGGRDATRPPDQQGCPHTACIGIPLVVLKGRVARHRPAEGIMVVGQWPTHVIESAGIVRKTGRKAIARTLMIVCPMGTSLGTRTVVRERDDQRIVPLAKVIDLLQQAPDLDVCVVHESGEYFFHSRCDPLLFCAEFIPDLNARIPRRQLLIWRQQSGLTLARQNAISRRVPPVVETAPILVGKFPGHVMWRVPGREREVKKERLVRIRGDQLPEPQAGCVHDIF